MDWIKKNYEKFTLLLLALALLAVSVVLFLGAKGFLADFSTLEQPVSPNNHIPTLDTKDIESAQQSLEKPNTWGFPSDNRSLFVSRSYVVKDDGNMEELERNPLTAQDGTVVPFDWLSKYHLDNLNNQTLYEDADLDGFTNLDEFKGNTDPTDKNSHPAYWTKLRLAEFIKVKFRLVYQGQPDDDTFQINTLDNGKPSQILKMGDTIEGTKYKIVNHEKKIVTDPDSGIEHDNSELTIQSMDPADGGAKVVLVKSKTIDSPDSYAKFSYLWHDATNPETPDFTVKKGQTFTIKPEPDVTYKVIDITDKDAKIQNLKTNDIFTVPHS